MQIPLVSSTPPPPVNKTILAAEEPARVSSVPVSIVAAAPPPAIEEEILTVLPASPTAAPPAVRRDYCLECGVDVTQRPRLQTCPDCGSLFCSARCYREHCYHAHPRHRR